MSKPVRNLKDGTKVRSNLVPRMMVGWNDLTDEQRKGLGYLETEEARYVANIFIFKGQAYDTGEFMCTEKDGALASAGWHGVEASSAFHAVVVHMCSDGDHVVVGEVFS